VRKIIFLFLAFSFILFLAGESMSGYYKAITDDFVNNCLRECTVKKSQLPDCGQESLVFIAQQYNLAASGKHSGSSGLYPCSNGSKFFDCRFWRSKQLHDLCPATVEGAKLPRWWNR
jgi:hypothetical protein